MKKFTLSLLFVMAVSLQAQELLTSDELNKRLTHFYEQPDSTILKSII
jgi:hypothetical protein